MSARSVTIVGFSLAGLRAAETLRRLGFDGSIHVVGAETRDPYDRPPLSKEVLTDSGSPIVPLRKDPIGDLDLDLHLGVDAVGLEVEARKVRLADGSSIVSDSIVIATGASARNLPASMCPPDLANLHVLRTADDALGLRESFEARPDRVAVVGAGFIGMEVAAACRTRELDVTVVEPLAQPMVRGLGETIGAACAQLHRDHGVDLRLGVAVDSVDGAGVALADGSRVDAGVVVVGIGATPNVEWLGGSGLAIDNGIVCDAALQAAPGVFAIGDVANFPNRLFDNERMRLEHWTNATEMAMHVADSIVNNSSGAFAPVPFVWSDQYDVKIQSVGRFDAQCDLHVAHGVVADNKFVALFGRSGRLVGALGFSQPRLVMQYRRMIADRATWAEALERAES